MLAQGVIYLAAAVIAVPLFGRLGLGSVLGYLTAGVIIGPQAVGLIGDVDAVLHFAELGVVLLLFIIGLELQPARLWALRKAVFGYGSVQVIATALLFGVVAWLCGIDWRSAVVIGFALALSSTAFALQTLAEKRELTTRHGRSAFTILLFQDLAVIPLLALLPLLVEDSGASGGGWLQALRALLVIGVVVLVGRYVLRHLLRRIADSGYHEVFTAMALLTVLGTALLVEWAGLSMALGAFLAGVLLADSQYRHELEANIEPFKGLLLGLFFIAVGMSVDLGVLVERPFTVAGLVAGLMTVKFALLFAIGRRKGMDALSSFSLATTLSQGGEFAFVLFNVAAGEALMEGSLVDLLILVVTVSMALTPLLFIVRDRLVEPWLKPAKEATWDQPTEEEHPVIIAGFGRFGQMVGRVLSARGIGFTALDASAEHVDFVREYGAKVFYGDASRLDLLRAAQADKARLFVLAIDDVEASLHTAQTVRRHFPQLRICARARNRKHAYQLMELGIELIQRETFLSALELTRQVLLELGLGKSEATRAIAVFRSHDEQRLRSHATLHNDEEKLRNLAKEASRELAEMFAADVADERDEQGRA